MEEKGESSYPSESSSGQPSIASIFNSIQQKLKGTSTQESSTSIFTANTTQISKPCNGVSDVSSSVSEPVDNASVSSVLGQSSHNSHSGDISVTSEVKNDNNTSETFEVNNGGITLAAPKPFCDSVVISTESSSGEVVSAEDEADDITDDDSANLQQEMAHCGTREDSAISSERSDRVTSGLVQTENPAGITVENSTHQSEVTLQQLSTASQDVQHQNNNIIIKQEKEDTGYERHCEVGAVAAEVDGEAYQTQRKEEPFLPGIKMEETEEGGKSSAGLWRVGWDAEDSDTNDDESDSDSSSLSSFGLDVELEPEKAPKPARARGDILPEDLPQLEDLYISLPEATWLEELGVVTSIVGVLVVIESTVDLEVYSPLNDDTVLFYENREPFGVVFEVFGQCKAPSYSVRFNSADDIREKGIEIGLKVFFVPNPDPEVGNITHYVFVQKLKQMKGSDASWKENNEPPENLLEYSDDEEEKRSKAKRKAGHSKGRRVTDNNEEEEEGVGKKRMGPGERRPVFSAHREAPSRRRPEGEDYSGPAKYPRTSFRKFSQPSSSFKPGRREFPFRRDFPLSEPVFRPSNLVRDSPHSTSSWGPPLPPSPTGPRMFGARPGPENAWARGPFMGGSGQGPFRDAQVRPPFSDRPRSTGVSDTLNARIASPFPDDRPSDTSFRSHVSDSPSSGSFGGGPFSNPGSRSFSDGPLSNPDSGSFSGRPLSNPSHGAFIGGPLSNPHSGSFGGGPFSNPDSGLFGGGPFSNPNSGSFGGPFSNPSHGSFSGRPLSNPGCQSFSNDPVRAPFSESLSKESFGSALNSNPFSDTFRKPPSSDSTFAMDMSVPPPNVFTFSAGQTSSPPPPLPPPWTFSPSPASSMGLGETPGSQSASTGGSQPFSFNFTHGQFDPPPLQQSSWAASPPPVRFQGGPQFTQYHKDQNWKW